VTAFISAVGRWFCLPPYWPSGFFGKCRPTLLGIPLIQLAGDALLTTLLLTFPALPLGAAICLLVSLLTTRTRHRFSAVGAGLIGAVLWVLLARRLESGYLDFILGGYAIGTGALAGLAVSLQQSRLTSAAGDTGQT
jgi:hypothetical protein